MRQALLRVDGVVDAVVEFDRAVAEVTYVGAAVQPEQLLEAVNRTAFSARLVESDPDRDQEDDR